MTGPEARRAAGLDLPRPLARGRLPSVARLRATGKRPGGLIRASPELKGGTLMSVHGWPTVRIDETVLGKLTAH
jgi:hypothetical protein